MRLLDQDELNQITESKDIPDPTQRLLWELHREDNRLCDRAVAEIERLRAEVKQAREDAVFIWNHSKRPVSVTRDFAMEDHWEAVEDRVKEWERLRAESCQRDREQQDDVEDEQRAEIERLRAEVESLKCLLGEGGKIAEIERLRNLVAALQREIVDAFGRF